MESNSSIRAPLAADTLAPTAVNSALSSAVDSFVPAQLPPRPPLIRTDSRSSFQAPLQRPPTPQQQQPQQQRPQFQPGGPILATQQFAVRPGTPAPRGPPILNPASGPQQARPQQLPLRASGPQSFAPQQPPKLLPTSAPALPPQRVQHPGNLQFGPRQQPQFAGPTTPEGPRPQFIPQNNVAPRNSVPIQRAPAPAPPLNQTSRQLSQSSLKGIDNFNAYPNQTTNLDNQSIANDHQAAYRPDNGMDESGYPKNRSYSIAAAPGAPTLFKSEEDRRKSVSGFGGKPEEYVSRNSGLGHIQEGKSENKDMTETKESVRAINEPIDASRNINDRPDSRLSGSKMTESFMESKPNVMGKKKIDDDDDVVLQTNMLNKNNYDQVSNQNKPDILNRSPPLVRNDDLSEKPKIQSNPGILNRPQNMTPDLQRPMTPKVDIKPEYRHEKILMNENISSKSPQPDNKPPNNSVNKKPQEVSNTILEPKTPRRANTAPKQRTKDGDNDSGVDESTQGNDLNGSPSSPTKKILGKAPNKEKSSSSLKPNLSRSSSKSAAAKTPENPPADEKKKVPMNKVQVGNAPSPNIKAVKSKIGSLNNTTYKPGGGKVKIENRKLDFNNATPRIAAKNDTYVPSGGVKKIPSTKLEWNAKSKIGSLQNTSYKPGGGDKKIETVKLDFKDKAKPKIASTVNITHKPGGGVVKIENHKLEFKAQSKIGSLDNVKHKPGGGEIKIFDDKEYIKQISGPTPTPGSHTHSRQEESYYVDDDEWEEEERPTSRCKSARAPRTPRTPRALSPRKHYQYEEEERMYKNNERNRRSMSRPMSAREPKRSACSRGSSIASRPAFTVY